jgi:hypothetical protein
MRRPAVPPARKLKRVKAQMAEASSVLTLVPPPLLLEKSSDTPSSQPQHDKMERQQSALFAQHDMTGQRAACSAGRWAQWRYSL